MSVEPASGPNVLLTASPIISTPCLMYLSACASCARRVCLDMASIVAFSNSKGYIRGIDVVLWRLRFTFFWVAELPLVVHFPSFWREVDNILEAIAHHLLDHEYADYLGHPTFCLLSKTIYEVIQRGLIEREE